VSDSFNGANGGSGWHQAGGGGFAGVHNDTVNATGSFMPGADGTVCPPSWNTTTGEGSAGATDSISHWTFSIDIAPGSCAVSAESAGGQSVSGSLYLNLQGIIQNGGSRPATLGGNNFTATEGGQTLPIFPGSSPGAFTPTVPPLPNQSTVAPGQSIQGGFQIQIPAGTGQQDVHLSVTRDPGNSSAAPWAIYDLRLPGVTSGSQTTPGDPCFGPSTVPTVHPTMPTSPLNRYSFSGLAASWNWQGFSPGNAAETISGTACGANPLGTVWTIKAGQVGEPAGTWTANFAAANPFHVFDVILRGSGNIGVQGQVSFSLGLVTGSSPQMVLSAVPSGNAVNLSVSPSVEPIQVQPVSSC
jgi:hypothetical protein